MVQLLRLHASMDDICSVEGRGTGAEDKKSKALDDKLHGTSREPLDHYSSRCVHRASQQISYIN